MVAEIITDIQNNKTIFKFTTSQCKVPLLMLALQLPLLVRPLIFSAFHPDPFPGSRNFMGIKETLKGASQTETVFL